MIYCLKSSFDREKHRFKKKINIKVMELMEFIYWGGSVARSKSDIANSTIRIFLQKVGGFYDEARGYEKYVPTRKQKQELLIFLFQSRFSPMAMLV